MIKKKNVLECNAKSINYWPKICWLKYIIVFRIHFTKNIKEKRKIITKVHCKTSVSMHTHTHTH